MSTRYIQVAGKGIIWMTHTWRIWSCKYTYPKRGLHQTNRKLKHSHSQEHQEQECALAPWLVSPSLPLEESMTTTSPHWLQDNSTGSLSNGNGACQPSQSNQDDYMDRNTKTTFTNKTILDECHNVHTCMEAFAPTHQSHVTGYSTPSYVCIHVHVGSETRGRKFDLSSGFLDFIYISIKRS